MIFLFIGVLAVFFCSLCRVNLKSAEELKNHQKLEHAKLRKRYAKKFISDESSVAKKNRIEDGPEDMENSSEDDDKYESSFVTSDDDMPGPSEYRSQMNQILYKLSRGNVVAESGNMVNGNEVESEQNDKSSESEQEVESHQSDQNNTPIESDQSDKSSESEQEVESHQSDQNNTSIENEQEVKADINSTDYIWIPPEDDYIWVPPEGSYIWTPQAKLEKKRQKQRKSAVISGPTLENFRTGHPLKGVRFSEDENDSRSTSPMSDIRYDADDDDSDDDVQLIGGRTGEENNQDGEGQNDNYIEFPPPARDEDIGVILETYKDMINSYVYTGVHIMEMNFKVNYSANSPTIDFISMVRALDNQLQGRRALVDVQIGSLLRSTTNGALRYYYSSNNTSILPILHRMQNSIQSTLSLARKLNSIDLNERILQRRPDTSWQCLMITNVKFLCYFRTN